MTYALSTLDVVQRRTAVFAWATCALLISTTVRAEPPTSPLIPLPLHNLTPYVQTLLSPSAPDVTMLSGDAQFSAQFDLSSHSIIEASGDTQLELDGETTRITLDGQMRLGSGWLLRAEVPLIVHSSGFTDRYIDQWHALTGLPDGERDRQPRDALLFGLRNSRGESLVRSQQQGVGDVRLSVARPLTRTLDAASSRSVWTQFVLKLPTGSAGRLTGSGAADAALSLHYAYEQVDRARPWAMAVDAYYLHIGDGDLLAQARTSQWQIGARLARQWTARLTPEIQLRVRSAAFDSEVNALGKTSVGIDTGVLIHGHHGYWRLGLSEDLNVDSAPDVTFYLHYARRR